MTKTGPEGDRLNAKELLSEARHARGRALEGFVDAHLNFSNAVKLNGDDIVSDKAVREANDARESAIEDLLDAYFAYSEAATMCSKLQSKANARRKSA